MARAMIASTYIRQLRSGLPLCCMHGLIAQEGWDSSRGRQKGSTNSAKRFHSHTPDLPNAPEGALELCKLQRADFGGGVPSVVSTTWPSSNTPAFNHFWIKRMILRSREIAGRNEVTGR